eukprot:GHVU01090847.1.p2 GENE.GHVU01090847.1~~GHVU01090847.1.p2  ORF type:complete len:104 (+),score=4.14 GHVU01090847.1:1004-1315(+)
MVPHTHYVRTMTPVGYLPASRTYYLFPNNHLTAGRSSVVPCCLLPATEQAGRQADSQADRQADSQPQAGTPMRSAASGGCAIWGKDKGAPDSVPTTRSSDTTT